MIEHTPPEIGANIDGRVSIIMAFGDNLILVASSEKWVQSLLDYTSNYLSNYGLLLNNNKSFTIAIRNVPHAKKSIVDRNIKFKCGDQELTALTRTSEWNT